MSAWNPYNDVRHGCFAHILHKDNGRDHIYRERFLKEKRSIKSESKRRYICVVEVLLTGNLERLLPSSNLWMFRVFIADDADCRSEELLFDITASFLEYVGGHMGIHRNCI